ncbi:MAG: hypothetical protein QNJ62_05490 [Methyloceanibacter sp.]|nr:hypothetical protein [Methyloceanibacter sp.]
MDSRSFAHTLLHMEYEVAPALQDSSTWNIKGDPVKAVFKNDHKARIIASIRGIMVKRYQLSQAPMRLSLSEEHSR